MSKRCAAPLGHQRAARSVGSFRQLLEEGQGPKVRHRFLVGPTLQGTVACLLPIHDRLLRQIGLGVVMGQEFVSLKIGRT